MKKTKEKGKEKKENKESLKEDDYLDLTPKVQKETIKEFLADNRIPDIEENIDIPISRFHSQGKKDVGTLSNPLSGVTKQSGELISKGNRKLQIERSALPSVDNHPAPERGNKNKKILWIIGIVALVLIIGNLSFMAYSFQQKDFNSTINVQTPEVNVNPSNNNNYTIINNQTIVVDVDPTIMKNIMGNISAIKDKLNMS